MSGTGEFHETLKVTQNLLVSDEICSVPMMVVRLCYLRHILHVAMTMGFDIITSWILSEKVKVHGRNGNAGTYVLHPGVSGPLRCQVRHEN